jgi:hypothetical protein
MFMNWIGGVRKYFSRRTGALGDHSTGSSPGDMAEKRLQGLMRMLLKTREEELTCDDVLRWLDRYAEIELSGQEAALLLPHVHQHIDLCPECAEELQALIDILQSQAHPNNT